MDFELSSVSSLCFSSSAVCLLFRFVSSFSIPSSLRIFSTRGSYSVSECAEGGDEGGLEAADLTPSGEPGVIGVELILNRKIVSET